MGKHDAWGIIFGILDMKKKQKKGLGLNLGFGIFLIYWVGIP
jgi:hypothetical protein